MSLVEWIGYDTHSKVMTKTMNGILLVLFFNTGILVILVNANLSEVNTTLGTIFDGQYYDYETEWYEKIGGTLCQTMFINAFMPIIFEIPVCLLRWIVIAKDSGLWLISGNKSHLRFYNTKTT